MTWNQHQGNQPLDIDKLWRSARPVVSAFVSSVVRDAHERDDLLQEISVSIVESIASYDPQRSFTAWAIGLGQKQLMRHLRDRKRNKLVFDERTITSLASAFSDLGREPPPYSRYFDECMEMLDERSKQLVELRYQQRLKVAEVAARLGMKPDTVFRALRRVRDQIRVFIRCKTDIEDAKPTPV